VIFASQDVRATMALSDARLDGWDLEGFQGDRDGGQMLGWFVTPAALAAA
jgi:hypothetical protein